MAVLRNELHWTSFHFQFFGFIDCSIEKINEPFSGSDGDYVGATRKEQFFTAEKAVYTAYKKAHGIKIEAIMLSNGISTIHGLVLARVHDLGGVL